MDVGRGGAGLGGNNEVVLLIHEEGENKREFSGCVSINEK